MTKNGRVPSRYTPSSVLYWPLLLPTFIRGVGATYTQFLLKVTFAKLSAFPHCLFAFSSCFFQGATQHSFLAWVYPPALLGIRAAPRACAPNVLLLL